MAKGPIITDEVRRTIVKVFLEHRDWRAKEIVDELNKRLKSKGPGLSAIQKELTKIRRNPAIDAEQDKVWSLDTLNDFPIPAEALPIVLWFWIDPQANGHPLSIRTVKWIARLYAVYGGASLLDFAQKRRDLERMAGKIALHEIIAEITGNYNWRFEQLELYEECFEKVNDHEFIEKLFSAPSNTSGVRRKLTEIFKENKQQGGTT